MLVEFIHANELALAKALRDPKICVDDLWGVSSQIKRHQVLNLQGHTASATDTQNSHRVLERYRTLSHNTLGMA